jgi:hypothetical protein
MNKGLEITALCIDHSKADTPRVTQEIFIPFDFMLDNVISQFTDSNLEPVDYKLPEIKAIPLDGQAPVILPSITVDSEAVRFEFEDGGVNLFWRDLFIGQRHPSFQAEVMENLFKAYNECIIARAEVPNAMNRAEDPEPEVIAKLAKIEETKRWLCLWENTCLDFSKKLFEDRLKELEDDSKFSK